MTMTTSDLSTDLKSWVPAEVPKVWLRPKPVGEWQTRAQVSTLLLPKPARTSFWTRNTSSLVQRDEVIAPTEFAPVRRLNALELARGIPNRLVPRHFAPRIFHSLADHRLEDAVPVGRVAVGEAALDAGMPLVGLAGL